MGCGCASRMRSILKLAKYELEEDGVWRKNGGPEFPDDRVEEHHFKVLIETLHNEAFKGKAGNFMNRMNRAQSRRVPEQAKEGSPDIAAASGIPQGADN